MLYECVVDTPIGWMFVHGFLDKREPRLHNRRERTWSPVDLSPDEVPICITVPGTRPVSLHLLKTGLLTPLLSLTHDFCLNKHLTAR